jgi:hypothetical protein
MSQLVPINITGQQYQSRSGQLSNQVTQNFYAELVEDPFGKAKYVLQPTPGLVYFGTGGLSSDRGTFEHLGVLYHVCGTVLYTVASDGTHTSRGTIAGAQNERVIFTAIGTNIVIVANAGANIYQWNGSALSAITDGDLETPQSAAHLNNQVIYQGDNNRFCSSDVGDATSIGALNYAAAESFADSLVRVYVFNQRLYLFCGKTIEQWWNSGQGNPPLDRVEGGIMQVGLAAKHSVASNDHRMYWLGDDRQVYVLMEGAAQQPVSNIAMHGKLSAYATISDAIGFCFTFQGQEFYCLSFPAQDESWLLNETTGWSTISSGTAGGRSIVNSHAFVFGKHIVSDYRSGVLYEWSATTYTENFSPIVKIRDSAPLHGGLFGGPGLRVEQNDLRLIMEVGTGADAAFIHMGLPNTSDSVSTPDSSAASIEGDIDIRAKVLMGSWDNGAASTFANKLTTGGQYAYKFLITSVGDGSKLQLQISPDGTAIVTATSTVAPSFTNGTIGWVRVTWSDSADEANFYTSTDGATWTQLGATVACVSAGIFDGTGSLSIGILYTRIYLLEIYNGIAGTLAVSMDAGDWVSGTTLTSTATGEVWTLNQQATAVASGEDPSITLAISDDGGNTFSAEIEADIGIASDFLREVRWNALGSFVDGRILRIKTSDRVFISIHGGTSYIELGI